MATTIATNVGTSMSAATGRPGQGHLLYSPSVGKWFLFYLTSTQTLSLAYATAINSTWTVSSTPFTLANPHTSEGRDFAFYLVTIGGVDYVHMCSTYAVSTTSTKSYHARFKLDNGVNPNTGWSTTNSETSETSRNSSSSGIPSGASVIIDSNGKVVDCNSFISSGTSMTDQRFLQYPNADTAASWTMGTPTQNVGYAPSTYVTSNAFADLGSSNLLAVCDNAATSGTFTALQWTKWTTSWSTPTTAVAATSTSSNQWGMVARTTTEVHLVALTDATSTYTHKIFNGTSWANGGSIGTLAPATNSGVFLATDGTSVWLMVIDSTKRIAYNKYSGGTWGGWTTLEAAGANARTYLTGGQVVSANAIGIVWTEANGSNFNIVGSQLGFPQTVSLGITTSSGTAVAVGHTSTGTVSRSISVASGTGSETGWSSAKGTGTASKTIGVGQETGTAPSVGRSVSGTVSKTIGVAQETTSLASLPGSLGVASPILGVSAATGSASTVSAQGTGTALKSISVANESGTAPALSGRGSGTTSTSINVASGSGSSPPISAKGTGASTRSIPAISVPGSVVGVTYSQSGTVSRNIGVANDSSSAIALSSGVVGTATRSIALASSLATDSSLSAHGIGSVSKAISFASETGTAPNLIGLGAGLGALGYISATGAASSIAASGTGSTSKLIGVANEATSEATLTGRASGAVSRNLTVASVTESSSALAGAPSGAANRSLAVLHETTSLGSLSGSLTTISRGIGVASANGTVSDVGQGTIAVAIGIVQAIATDSLMSGRLDLSLFRVDPNFVSLVN